MRTLQLSVLAALLCGSLLSAAPAHAERRVVIIHSGEPERPRLQMSAPMVERARAAAAGETDDTGVPPGQGPRVTLPQMQVSAISTTVDGRREVLLQDPGNPQNTASVQWPKRPGDPAVQFSVGQTVNVEPAGSGGWQMSDGQGRPLEYLPEATGPRDIFDTQH